MPDDQFSERQIILDNQQFGTGRHAYSGL
jgi:hypothetical protein